MSLIPGLPSTDRGAVPTQRCRRRPLHRPACAGPVLWTAGLAEHPLAIHGPLAGQPCHPPLLRHPRRSPRSRATAREGVRVGEVV